MYLSNGNKKILENFKKNFQNYLMFIMLKKISKIDIDKKKNKSWFFISRFL